MFKTIVWATDGSVAADRALPFAKALAGGDAKLIVVHVKELLTGRAGGYPVHADEDELTRKVREQADALTSLGYEVRLELATAATMSPARVIAEIARDAGADLIVVGTRGHGPVASVFAGSTTQRLLHLASCPVLGVPPLEHTPLVEHEAAERARDLRPSLGGDQLGQVGDDGVGACCEQPLRVAGAVDADNLIEARGTAGRYVGRPHDEERRRSRLDAELGAGRGDTAGACVDELAELGAIQHPARVRAGRHDRAGEAGLGRLFEIEASPIERGHALPVEAAKERLVLAVREAVHGLGARRIVGPALRQPDPAAREECPHAVEPRLAVQVQLVVDVPSEWCEWCEALAQPLDAPGQQLVEGVAPCCGMHRGAAGQDAFEVEHAGPRGRPQAERRTRGTSGGKSMDELDALFARRCVEQTLDFSSFLREPSSPDTSVRVRECRSGPARVDPERLAGGVERRSPLHAQAVQARGAVGAHGDRVSAGASSLASVPTLTRLPERPTSSTSASSGTRPAP
jgi:nucleotide-binding universal stress UspA family protein